MTVDAAGAHMGGAARFLTELDGYLGAARAGTDVTVIGRSRSLSAAWLLQRECGHRSDMCIALNNVSFVRAGRRRSVLLRNALHFPLPEDDVRGQAALDAQARMVRACASRADRIVVPSSAMRDRVLAHVPRLADRIVVRAHPLSVSAGADRRSDRPVLLVPVLFAPYKRMPDRLSVLVTALASEHRQVEVRVTGSPKEVGPELLSRGVVALGRLSSSAVLAQLANADYLYYPTTVESFGYPLAEARALGVPVLAHDSQQNREVAGPALAGYAEETVDAVRSALQVASALKVAPDARPFDRDAYFDWLLDG